MTKKKPVWVVGYDFSDESETAVEYAAAALGGIGGRLVLVHAIEPPNKALRKKLAKHTRAFEALDNAGELLLAAAREAVGERLSALKEDYPKLGVAKVVAIGDPVDLLLEVATRDTAVQIVMGTRGLRGLKLLGSVTRQVLRKAELPVVVLRADRDADEEVVPE